MNELTELNNFLPRVLRQIHERAPVYFPEIESVIRTSVIGTSHRAYSDIYRVVISNGRAPAREVVVKVCGEAEVQFRAMTAVWPHFAAHPTWKIPRPLDYLDDGPAIVMEAVSGSSLQARLPWLPWVGRWLRTAESDFRRAGQWLCFYHHLGRSREPGSLDVHTKWQGLEQSLNELAQAGFDSGLCRRMADGLQPLTERLSDQPVTVSHVHGDFTADNLLVDGDRVIVLDLWGKFLNAVEHDIASFLNSLLFLSPCRPVPRSVLRRLRTAFLRGYFGPGQHDESVILFLQGIGVADVALEIINRRRSVLARAWVEHVVAGAVEELVSISRKVR